MYFEKGQLYHIYNQGNNRQDIFFCRKNYLFFLKKIKTYIWPFADILAWCLMPNHFHLMLHCKSTEITHGVTASHPVSDPRTFNDSIGIMLRSYTRAVNKLQQRTGSLFREETKALCLSQAAWTTSNWFIRKGITQIENTPPELQHPAICFNYILYNPVRVGLVEDPNEWEFSSFREMTGDSEELLINKSLIAELGLKCEVTL
jgi:putative transposase